MKFARLLCLQGVLIGAPAESLDFFETKVRPVLVNKCHACHTGARLGGLRLDSREAILTGGKTGPAIIAGEPENSLLILAVSRRHQRLKMPPSDPLSDAEVADLSAWVKAGAAWPEVQTVAAGSKRDFWSFQPIRHPAVPAIRNKEWARGPIDHFILGRLEQQNLEPMPQAGKAALIRRASFDLTGLPPAPEEVDRFLQDPSPTAFAQVVDRLLASNKYGERWGRYWLDLARYADGTLGASKDTPLPNAYRYRDWVISSLNQDLPYNRMLEAQIAADFFEQADRGKYLPGLGFQALGGDAHERLDVTTKTFLGLTVGCAQCHNHKFDPVSTADYYSLYGVLASTVDHKAPMAPENKVQAYQKAKAEVDRLQEEIDDVVRILSTELGEALVFDTARYLLAAWDKTHGQAPVPDGLNAEILERWIAYLKQPRKDHQSLQSWQKLTSRKEAEAFADRFQQQVIALFTEKRDIDERNYIKLGGEKGAKDEATRQYTNLESLQIEKYYLWRDLASDPFQRNGVFFPGGIYYYGITNRLRRDFEVRGVDVPAVRDIDPFLSPHAAQQLDRMRAKLQELQKAVPPEYPYLHAVRDSDTPKNARIHIRGDAQNLGDEAPRRFLPALSDGEPRLFKQGSGRGELARAISSHPLAARVMVNRLWAGHFGYGIVRSPSNFGQLGERPTHPELLEYLAARLIESGWSLKALHREIMLSAAYSLGTRHSEKHAAADPENRLLWRANLVPRLDAESLRDSMLFVAGRLSTQGGGPPAPLDDSNTRRTIYGYIGRTTLDPMLSLFDFPNPNNTSEQRSITLGPMQRLYFLNNSFVALQADAFAERIKGAALSDEDRIRLSYRLAYGRPPEAEEMKVARQFLRASGGAWPQFTQALLTSSEFSSIP